MKRTSVNLARCAYHADLQFSDGPITAARVLVDNGDLQVAVEDWFHVARPVAAAFQPARLRTLGHHDDRSTVVLPDHAPEVVLGRRQRTLSGDELALRAETLSSSASRDTPAWSL